MIGLCIYGAWISCESEGKALKRSRCLPDYADVAALTESYTQAILEKAGNAANLGQARRFIAQERGIIA
mgnify:CR=1 FL=1